MFRFLFNPRYPLFLLVLFIVYATLWAIRPVNFNNWVLENVLTAIAVAFLVWTWTRGRAPEVADETAPLDPQIERLVDEELARFDT